MVSLWEALGRPPLVAALPGPRTAAWGVARDCLIARLRAAGSPARIWTAGAFWRILAGAAPAPGASWEQLCALGDFEMVVRRVAGAAGAAGPWISSWNARWLLSPHTDRAARKRAVVARALQSGGYATDPAYADKLVALMDQIGGLANDASRITLR